MAAHVHDANGSTTNTQTMNGVVYDVTTIRCSCGHVTGGSSTPR